MAETAPRSRLSQQEAAALGLAVLGHVALVAALIYLKPADPPPPPPGRMAVSLTSETGLISTAPDPQPDAALDAGPVVGDMAPPPEAEPIPLAKAEPLRQPAPALRPLVRPLTPQAKPATRPPRPQPNTKPPRPGTKPGNSSFDSAFGDGIPEGNNKGPNKNPPAQATGAQKERWKSSVMDRVLPRFGACVVSGLDVDKLYADIVFTLSIDGKVQSVDQVSVGGITPSNRAQAEPMKACARKAALQGAPYLGLPSEYYNDWKTRRMRLRVRD